MWYVIQTMSGQEEHVIQMIRKIVPSELYTDCFTLYYERLWRKQQKSIVHVERLFSGYVFIITDCPQEIFFHLKDVPALSKLMSDPNFVFLPLNQDEETFFSQVSDDEHVVRLSYVKTGAGGHILRISGSLSSFADRVVKYNFKKRYAIVELDFLNKKKTVVLGILLDEDIRQELEYGKIEMPMKKLAVYPVDNLRGDEPESQKKQQSEFSPGDEVEVVAEALKGMHGFVWRVKSRTAEIGIRMFQQDIAVELSFEEIKRVSSYKDDYAK